MSFFITTEINERPKYPQIVRLVLASENLLKIVPINTKHFLRDFIFLNKRICSASCGCPLAINERSEFQQETGGVIHVNENGDILVDAHVGEYGKPFVVRSLTKEAAVGFHSHIVETRRRFNPPTTTDVNFYITLRRQEHKIKREAELVFTEEGVYVIHGCAQNVTESILRNHVGKMFKTLWPDAYEKVLFVDGTSDNSKVPFFGKRDDLDAYLKIYEFFGVYIDLVDWNETSLRK